MTTELRSYTLAPIADLRVADSGDGDGSYTIKGNAIVYGQRSVNLGGFTEVMAPGSLRDVLASAPDVHLLWQHDPLRALARTRSNPVTLELREDSERGVAAWARVVATSYAADLRALLEAGVVDQMSFAFTTPEDGSGESWEFKDDGTVTRTVTKVDGLFDVTICARGAYPQTDVAVSQRSLLERAKTSGRILGWAEKDGGAATAQDERSDASASEFAERKAAAAAANARLIDLA